VFAGTYSWGSTPSRSHPIPEHYDGGLLDALGAREVAAILATLGDAAENPFDSLRIRRLGGALTQRTPAAAVGRIEEPFLIFGVAIGPDDAVGEAVAEATARLRHALGPTLKRQAIPNFVGTTAQAAVTYAPPDPTACENSSDGSTPTACCGSIRRCRCRTDLLEDGGREHPREVLTRVGVRQCGAIAHVAVRPSDEQRVLGGTEPPADAQRRIGEAAGLAGRRQ
jgi:hypothetical protein